MKKRRYTLKKRAESRDDTRARIVDAMIRVHQEMGPRNATVSAIAERAGVQRLTVYRHFPDDASLFEACTSTWLERNPPPELEALARVADAPSRTREGLEALYRYYRNTRQMWSVSYRDVELLPALQRPMSGFEDYLNVFRETLLRGWPLRGRRRDGLSATLALALRFHTWETLDGQGLGDAAMAALVTGWIEGLRGDAA